MKLGAVNRAFIQFTLILAVMAWGGVASAQDIYAPKSAPVVDIKTDENGVDLRSGSLIVKSPFSFNSPGASRLNINTIFNGKRISYSLNYYLDDITFTCGPSTWCSDSPNTRHIKVHLGGVDKLFLCAGVGTCQQVGDVDGARLVRVQADNYEFTDRDGTFVKFFTLARNPLYNECYLEDVECNFAEYEGYAYASEVKFATGEKLTFDPFYDKIYSNLGYEIRIDGGSTLSNGYPNKPGWNWLTYRHDISKYGSPRHIELFKSGSFVTRIRSLSSAPTPNTKSIVETDILGRQFQVSYASDPLPVCGGTASGWEWMPQDMTYLVPRTVVTPGGRQTTASYTEESVPGSDAIVSVVSALSRGGLTWNYAYGAAAYGAGTVTVTDPLQGTKTITSRAFSSSFPSATCGHISSSIQPLEVVDQNQRNWIYRYEQPSLGGRLTSHDEPSDNGFNFQYDARGNVTQVTERATPASGTASRVVFTAGYDATCTQSARCNKPNWIRDARNSQWDFEYDPVHGGVTKATLPPNAAGVRGIRTYTYQAHDTGSGLIYRLHQTAECLSVSSCPGTADQLLENYTYWGNTFLVATKTSATGDGSLSRTHSWTYDSAGRTLTETNPGGGVTSYFYDVAGRRTGEIGADPDGASSLQRPAKRTVYDNDDLVLRIDEGYAASASASASALAAMVVVRSTELTYDSVGRKTSELRKGSNGSTFAVTQYSYDGAGRLECTAVRMNPAVFGSLPASACTLGTAGANGPDRITRNFYDAAGQLLKVQKAVGTSVQIDYARYEYTPNGKQKAVIDANGNRAEYTYDGYDRRVKWAFPSKTTVGQVNAADYEQYGYDANGNRTSLRKRDGQTIAYTYDALNRVTLKDLPTGSDVYYGYDLRGLQLYARFGSTSGYGITNVYDGFGRQTSATTNFGGVTRTLGYQWDANGNRIRVTHPDGVYFTYVYDGLDRATAIQENGTTQVASITYDNAGRRSGSTRAGAAITYGYDGISRLASLSDNLSGTANDVALSFTYNPASQIVTRGRNNDAYRFTGYVNVNRAYAVNGLNQYTTAGSATFCHDANGNLTLDGSSAYKYDIENRLVERRAQVAATCPAVNYTGALQAHLTYDTMGRLRRTHDGVNYATHYVYDGDELVLEVNSWGDVVRRYVHGPGTDDPMLWYEGATVSSATRRSLQSDHQGSIVSVADSAGSMLAINAYDEYGIPKSGNLGRFQYTGQAWIPELGMYHYKARIYSPTLGRFLQTDPIGYEDQVNLYAYVGNDPMNDRDPSGKNCIDPKSSLCGRSRLPRRGHLGTGYYLRKVERTGSQATERAQRHRPQAKRGNSVAQGAGKIADVVQAGADAANDGLDNGPGTLPKMLRASSRLAGAAGPAATFIDQKSSGKDVPAAAANTAGQTLVNVTVTGAGYVTGSTLTRSRWGGVAGAVAAGSASDFVGLTQGAGDFAQEVFALDESLLEGCSKCQEPMP